NNQPTTVSLFGGFDVSGKLVRIRSVQDVIWPSFIPYFPIRVCQHVCSTLIAETCAETSQMSVGGFADASFASAKKNDLGLAHASTFSKASIMICWAETTLPSSLVRSDAFSTNLFQRLLSGRRVIGIVCWGCFCFAFLA